MEREDAVRRDHLVDLLAVDEWLDTDTERTLLPSFVLPGDPIVPRIIDAAQRYLVALLDDAGPGSTATSRSRRRPTTRTRWWKPRCGRSGRHSAQDFSVRYINPPPTYTKDSQRLRTPSDVIEGRRGTCIDLALLTMACLEYIEVYPVIFLLGGHAFPGYWRSPIAQREFVPNPRDAARAPGARRSQPGGRRDGSARPATEAWHFGGDVLRRRSGPDPSRARSCRWRRSG